MTNSLSGVREEASILFADGLLLMKQQDLQEASWERKGARWRTKNTGMRYGMRCRVDLLKHADPLTTSN
ncbi:unnamed protein product [Cochlearia groenlandica]